MDSASKTVAEIQDMKIEEEESNPIANSNYTNKPSELDNSIREAIEGTLEEVQELCKKSTKEFTLEEIDQNLVLTLFAN